MSSPRHERGAAVGGGGGNYEFAGPPPGLNTTRLGFVVTKLLTLFRMRSFGTHPTATHAAWLPAVVGNLQFLTPAFGYTALDGSAGLAAIAPLWAGVEVETVVLPPPPPPLEAPPPPAAYPPVDALLYWPPAPPTEELLRSVAVAARAGGVAYLIVGSHPQGPPGSGVVFEGGRWVVTAAGRGGVMAGRTDAFMCGKGVRGVVPMLKGGGSQRYLVVYRVVDMDL
ncbi:hypothetical protein MMPV_004113 [Pyropia vietnamensis]